MWEFLRHLRSFRANDFMAVLRFITAGNGVQFVMMTGVSMMPMKYVVSWAFLVHPGLLLQQSTARGLVYTITSAVKDERRCSCSVPMM